MNIVHTFFLRVSARCNMACNYCYVFKHKDMSWKNYPPVMSEETILLFTSRLIEYVTRNNLDKVYLVYHGGEPLLIGKSLLLKYTDIILNGLSDIVHVEFSLQTNGTLLTDKFLEECDKRKIRISLSIDGSEDIHNQNRKLTNGTGSFRKVISGIKKAQKYPHLFQGVIGVINPYSDPDELLQFYKEANLCNIDLLLPDANFDRPPVYRDSNPNIYKNWLVRAFDIWFDKYQDISYRTFECILNGVLGMKVPSDSFGYGTLNYLTIEADGSYHTTDILKVAYENASAMGINVQSASIDVAVNHNKVQEYNQLLMEENLPRACKLCDVKDICGAGSLPHRYSQQRQFNNPTVYCGEMRALIAHAKQRIISEIEKELLREKFNA